MLKAETDEIRLLAILANPPLGTSGVRTLRRVDRIARLVGASRTEVANLFILPSYRTTGVSAIGAEPSGWLDARQLLLNGLDGATDVILAYGTQEPTGDARTRHRDQVTWLRDELARRNLKLWAIGGRTGHPSRWQRLTYARWPELTFDEALAREFGPYALPAT